MPSTALFSWVHHRYFLRGATATRAKAIRALRELALGRDQRLSVHLVVAQGSVVGIERNTIEWQLERSGDTQAAADQDKGDQQVGRVAPPVQVGAVGRPAIQQSDMCGAMVGQPNSACKSAKLLLEHETSTPAHRSTPTCVEVRNCTKRVLAGNVRASRHRTQRPASSFNHSRELHRSGVETDYGIWTCRRRMRVVVGLWHFVLCGCCLANYG